MSASHTGKRALSQASSRPRRWQPVAFCTRFPRSFRRSGAPARGTGTRGGRRVVPSSAGGAHACSSLRRSLSTWVGTSLQAATTRRKRATICIDRLYALSSNQKIFSNQKAISVCWRRERDSNPRYGFPHTRTPSVRLRPLGHPSGTLQRSDSRDPLNRQSGRRRGTVFHRPPTSGLSSEQSWLEPRWRASAVSRPCRRPSDQRSLCEQPSQVGRTLPAASGSSSPA